MKPRSILLASLACVLVAGTTLTLVSWDRKQTPDRFYQQTPRDTTPEKKKAVREKQTRDLDEALDQVNKMDIQKIIDDAMETVKESMKNIDMDKIKMQIDDAMKGIDMDKIHAEIDNAMKDIDMNKIQAEINNSMKDVDMEKIQEEVREALKEVDMEKIKREVNESIAKVDWNEIKAEIEKAKNIDMKEVKEQMEKVQEELKNLGPEIKQEMEKAKVEIEKAKVEVKEYKEFVDGLDKDGLINKKDSYTITHKNGELFINGKKASQETYNKYRSFLEKHKSLNIKRDKDDSDIDL